MNASIKEYFQFSKGQQRGIWLLLILIAGASLFRFYLPSLAPKTSAVDEKEIQRLMALIVEDSSADFNPDKDEKVSQLTPFPFDPNTLDEAGFRRLGLREKLVSTLIHYRNKGGRFYNKESMKRIYGLREEEYRQLEAYISIPSTSFKKEPTPALIVELNTCDTSQLIRLRGIGSKLASNIIQYRERLGGFARVEQIKEVFGIREETYEQINKQLRVDTKRIRQLNLNEATYYELNAHPYLKGELARALVDLRKAHDYHIDHSNQIQEIPLINDEIFRKIAPYLRVH